MIVQYWLSFEQLEAFAKDKDDPHLDTSGASTRAEWERTAVPVSGTKHIWGRRGSTRLFTETCRRNVLGKAGRPLPVSESSSARLGWGAKPFAV
jgi:hypothetical protein